MLQLAELDLRSALAITVWSTMTALKAWVTHADTAIVGLPFATGGQPSWDRLAALCAGVSVAASSASCTCQTDLRRSGQDPGCKPRAS